MKLSLLTPVALGLGGLLAVVAVAQTQAATVTLTPAYAPGSTLTYSVTNHAQIGTSGASDAAQLDTAAEVVMHILPGATPGSFDAELHFTKYVTTIQAGADVAKQLQAEYGATDQAALHMNPAHFRVHDGQFETVSRTQGQDYDQPVLILEELARTDSLPLGPTAVGDKWTKQRSRPIPTLNYSVLLKYDCTLTALGQTDGQPSATITVHSTGNATLPPGSIPGSSELAAQGVVPEASVIFNNDTTDVYRASDAVLLSQSSVTHNQMHMRLIGPNPNPTVLDRNIDSTGTVKLESIQP